MHPDIVFIVHAEEIEDEIGDLMDKYPNIYYTADNLHETLFPLFMGEIDGKGKEAFLTALNQDFNILLENDVSRWKHLIESHPDRFMWGTDRGDAVWNYDPEVGQLLAEYTRAFIGRLDPDVQEKFAYKNAETLLQGR